jgi:hypothetical protein
LTFGMALLSAGVSLRRSQACCFATRFCREERTRRTGAQPEKRVARRDDGQAGLGLPDRAAALSGEQWPRP